jgi:ankyrin repeat protein
LKPLILECSPIEFAVNIKRIDIVELLVMAGAHPIHPLFDSEGKVSSDDIPQILFEYYQFGTNEYICWLLNQHLRTRDIPDFVAKVVGLSIFDEEVSTEGVEKAFDEVGRHPAHALLLCGNEEMVTQLLAVNKSFLTVKNHSLETALQIGTRRGNLKSIETLLKFYG